MLAQQQQQDAEEAEMDAEIAEAEALAKAQADEEAAGKAQSEIEAATAKQKADEEAAAAKQQKTDEEAEAAKQKKATEEAAAAKQQKAEEEAAAKQAQEAAEAARRAEAETDAARAKQQKADEEPAATKQQKPDEEAEKQQKAAEEAAAAEQQKTADEAAAAKRHQADEQAAAAQQQNADKEAAGPQQEVQEEATVADGPMDVARRSTAEGETTEEETDASDSENTVVCVTGVSGYLGSVLAARLLERGYSVVGLHAALGGPSLIRVFVTGTVRSLLTWKAQIMHQLRPFAKGGATIEIEEADLLDAESLVMSTAKCHVLMHTASPFWSHGRASLYHGCPMMVPMLVQDVPSWRRPHGSFCHSSCEWNTGSDDSCTSGCPTSCNIVILYQYLCIISSSVFLCIFLYIECVCMHRTTSRGWWSQAARLQ